MPCRPIYFYLHMQVGILSLALHVPWPRMRGAYAPPAKSDSLIKSVGKIKIVNHAHLRALSFACFYYTTNFIIKFFGNLWCNKCFLFHLIPAELDYIIVTFIIPFTPGNINPFFNFVTKM